MELYDSNYAQRITQKWSKVLDEGPEIMTDITRQNTAMVLENTEREFKGRGMITEAGMVNQGTGGILGSADPANPSANGVLGNGDFHWPSIVIPMVRRIFPSLISHEIVDVQPMNGPVGFAFAFRAFYGTGILGDGSLVPNKEIGYNYVDSRFTGTSAADIFTGSSTSANYWADYSGVEGNIGTKFAYGEGQNTGTGEYADVNGKYPMAKFHLLKQSVEAKTRKLAANWSPELAEDMMATQGVDVASEMQNVLAYEIAAEIDRQLLNEQVKTAITGGKVSTWTPVSADGRNQLERIGTMLTHLNIKGNTIAETTRRGSANFCIASTRVTSLLQRLHSTAFVSNEKGKMPTLPNTGVGSLLKVGLINAGAQLLIRDTFAGGDYALLGYKGANKGDSGIIYCPYIPVQMMKAVRTDDFSPEIGARTRYGVLNHCFGSENYYQFVGMKNLAGVGCAGDDDGTRQFTYA